MCRLVNLSPEEAARVVPLALGRLFRLCSRPLQPGDLDTYHKLRSLVLDVSPEPRDDRPDYVRDRLKGAADD